MKWVVRGEAGREAGGRKEGRTEAGSRTRPETCVVPAVLLFFLLGSTVTAEIQGVIDACVKLTGMPDLTLSFMVMPRAIAHLMSRRCFWKE